MTPLHAQTQTSENVYFFVLLRPNENNACALFQITFDNIEGWISPVKAPFGGVQADETCSSEELLFLIFCVENFVRERDGKRITVKTAPAFYNGTAKEKLSSCYLKSGFQKSASQVNHFISVSQNPFKKLIVPAERRRLLKCQNAGFTSRIMESPDIGFVYNFLTASRNCLGYTLSMTKDRLNDLVTTFPEEITVFIVENQTETIALSVVVQVNKNVVYNFLSGDIPDYRQYSPMVFLTESIYDYCQNKSIGIIDLGTSADNYGTEKPGLMRFKKNIGGIEDYKIEYRKMLNT